MSRLFHVSDRADIQYFEPRVSPSQNSVVGDEKVVWAIGERLLHNYLLPRDCPRVTFYAGDSTSKADVARFWLGSSAKYIVAVESSWVHTILNTQLYCYELPPDEFKLIDDIACYYVCPRVVEPIQVTEYSDLFQTLTGLDVEVRILPSLWPLRDAVVDSTLRFSIIRMRNAQPRMGSSSP